MIRTPSLRSRLLLPAALLLVSVPVLGGTALAGGTCSATHEDAPIYAGNNPWTDIVGYLDPGVPVNGTRQGADALWQVSRADNGAPLGFMRAADLTCDGG
ncbi:hypothetical protein [Streptomyces sp. AcE210]|uniref:hypothetical protein n=1 Tax=Streptomyces sp. AcE210 TaxID=2292703 RepID=UPI000E305490|nr:hypothetical protein [Streptomyces sp. AcE210]RFC70259.1 hypothetical protein DXZ75_23075 [Streptomyces sp. AcE210]